MSDCQAEAARWLRDASCQQVTPSQRVQISIENSRCEFRSAGLQTPAECLETLAEPELVGCTEALSRSPQLWTSYISHLRDFDRQCAYLSRRRDVDTAKELWKESSVQQRQFVAQAADWLAESRERQQAVEVELHATLARTADVALESVEQAAARLAQIDEVHSKELGQVVEQLTTTLERIAQQHASRLVEHSSEVHASLSLLHTGVLSLSTDMDRLDERAKQLDGALAHVVHQTHEAMHALDWIAVVIQHARTLLFLLLLLPHTLRIARTGVYVGTLMLRILAAGRRLFRRRCSAADAFGDDLKEMLDVEALLPSQQGGMGSFDYDAATV